MIEKHLMTFEEYRKIGKHSVPYIYSISKGTQFLYYFGANHSRDPEDSQFKILSDLWREFLEKNAGKNCVVLIEGGKRVLRNSEEEAIHKGSEAGFITYLASKEGMDTFSPEPPERSEFEGLLRFFAKEEIAFYHLAKTAFQWNRIPESTRDEFDVYIGKALSNMRNRSRWDDFDFSLQHLIKIHQDIFKTAFNENDIDFFKKITSPSIDFSIINEVSRTLAEKIREPYILKEIERFWNEGKNIFIVYGASHAVMHEKAIKGLVD